MDSMVWVEVPIEEWLSENNSGTHFVPCVNNVGNVKLFTIPYGAIPVNYTHVLVKKPLSEVIKDKMPTEEEIEEEMSDNSYTDNAVKLLTIGAKWLRHKLLNNG